MSCRTTCNVRKGSDRCTDAKDIPGTNVSVDVDVGALREPKNKPYARIALFAVVISVFLIIFFQPDLGLLPTAPLQGDVAFAINFLIFTLLGFGIGIGFVIIFGIAVKKKKERK